MTWTKFRMLSSSTRRRRLLFFLFAAFVAGSAVATDYAPYPTPGAGYVTDAAGVLSHGEEERIEHWLRSVEERSGTEIIVVTIHSISDYPGTENSSIESFATGLFNRWGIGNRPRNDGILLLVAVSDRKARIELGAGYGKSRDGDSARIMREVIVPRFRKGDIAGGITRGVKAIVNEFTTVRIGVPWPLILVPAAAVVFLLIGVSLIRNGRRGWGWVFIGLALLLLVVTLYVFLWLARQRSGDSGGWAAGGVGGFGGGFSGGGGATGSW